MPALDYGFTFAVLLTFNSIKDGEDLCSLDSLEKWLNYFCQY